MSRNLVTLMDQIFDDSFRPLNSRITKYLGTAPALNVKEYKNRYEITLTIPGLEAGKIKIELDDKILNINYTHEEEENQEAESGEILREEYSYYSFSRSVALPKNIEPDSVKAKSAKGILTITVHKHPETQPRAIEVDNQD